MDTTIRSIKNHVLLCFIVLQTSLSAYADESIKSIELFNHTITVSEGDYILISNPSNKPLADVWRYEHVYSGYSSEMPYRSPALKGTSSRICVVLAIFKLKTDNSYFVSLRDDGTGKIIYADIRRAILKREAELVNSTIINKMTLYNLYLKSLKSVSEKTGEGYLKTFMSIPPGINEFEKKKAVVAATAVADTLRMNPTNTANRKYITEVNVDKYDFKTQSFPTDKMSDMIQYDVSLENNINSITLNFKNLNNQFNIKVDERKAEEIVTKYMGDFDRKLYCIYTFNIVEKTGKADNYGNFIIDAEIKSIEFFADADCIQKVTTIQL